MEKLEKQAFIRQKLAENQGSLSGENVLWSRHATAELVNDGLVRADVEASLQQCEIIEDYSSTRRPLPDCLVLGSMLTGAPVHAVLAIDEAHDRIFVVTVYVPTSERWEDDWRTRRA